MALPAIPVPLLTGDDDVLLDLQQAFETIYDALSYDLSVNYNQPLDIPLTGKAKQWAEVLLANQ